MHVISSLILSILRSWYQKATPINCIKVIKWSLLEQNQSPAWSQDYPLNELMQNDESSDTRTTTMNSQESTPGAMLHGEHSFPKLERYLVMAKIPWDSQLLLFRLIAAGQTPRLCHSGKLSHSRLSKLLKKPAELSCNWVQSSVSELEKQQLLPRLVFLTASSRGMVEGSQRVLRMATSRTPYKNSYQSSRA